MLKIIKKLILIVFFIILITPICTFSQDNTNNYYIEQISNILGIPIISIISIIYDNIELGETAQLNNDSQQDITNDLKSLLEEVAEIAKIPENERTSEQWKRLIQIVLTIAYSGAESTEILLKELLVTLQQNKELMDKNNQLIKEKDSLIFENNEINKSNLDLIHQLGLLKQSYDSMISFYENVVNDIKTIPINVIFLIPVISLQGSFGLGVSYIHSISWFCIGAGLSINDMSSLPGSMSINLSIGFKF